MTWKIEFVLLEGSAVEPNKKWHPFNHKGTENRLGYVTSDIWSRSRCIWTEIHANINDPLIWQKHHLIHPVCNPPATSIMKLPTQDAGFSDVHRAFNWFKLHMYKSNCNDAFWAAQSWSCFIKNDQTCVKNRLTKYGTTKESQKKIGLHWGIYIANRKDCSTAATVQLTNLPGRAVLQTTTKTP